MPFQMSSVNVTNRRWQGCEEQEQLDIEPSDLGYP